MAKKKTKEYLPSPESLCRSSGEALTSAAEGAGEDAHSGSVGGFEPIISSSEKLVMPEKEKETPISPETSWPNAARPKSYYG